MQITFQLVGLHPPYVFFFIFDVPQLLVQLQLELLELVPALDRRRLTLSELLHHKVKLCEYNCATYHTMKVLHLNVALSNIFENGC